MMLKPAHIQTLSYFYAAGNTPAVCLTQSVPPGHDAALLLLGCGDARSILFTAYSRPASENCKLDITCCDIEAEIIARNLLLYTLLLDDQDGQKSNLIWNIYYHIMLDTESLDLLRMQAQKLENLAASIEDWHKGTYGHLLRFCDTTTFSRVVRLWRFYALNPSHGKGFRDQQEQLKASFKRARDVHKEKVGDGIVLSGIRSAAPCSMLAIRDVPKFLSEYWKTGVALADKRMLADSKHLNPMFGTLHQDLTLHYGTEPFLGFHLATGYAQLSSNSPLQLGSSKLKGLKVAAEAALSQFCAWGENFRLVSGQLVIRFVASDALAFCHVLQHHRIHQDSRTASWYRDNWHYEPLILDSEDYSPQGSAPTSFDVIDTSNLVDHLGSLNLLAACAPLLAHKASSALYKEILVLQDESIEAYVKGLLCGDLPTVLLLLGLKPVQYWTGSSTSSTFDESMLTMMGQTSLSAQSRYIMVLKSTALSAVKFDAKELAHFVYNMYLQMFQDESWANRFSANPITMMRKPYERYTRASLSAILRLIKNSQLVDWDSFIQLLCDRLVDDRVLNLGAHYIQELYVHLHLFELRTEMVYQPDMLGFRENLKDSPLRRWQSIPSTVCLTFAVPHQKLAVFHKKSPTGVGSPICHIMLQSPYDGRQNTFPDLQLGFGNIRTAGTKYTDNFATHVEADESEWQGNKPLIVSTMVPTWIVLCHADFSTEVIFALKSTPTSMMLAGELGMFLEIHKSTLSGKDVFITRHLPNLEGYMSVSCPPKIQDLGSHRGSIGPSDPQVSFHASLDSKATKISRLNIHADLASTEGKDLLRLGAVVNVKQLSPFRIELNIGSGSFRREIRLPVPLTMSGGKTTIARKSSYVEFAASVASPAFLTGRADALFPIPTQQGMPILESIPYIKLDCLPILDLRNSSKLEWMTTHLSAMWSARERSERERCRISGVTCMDTRVNFKDSLFSMFSHLAGIGGAPQHAVFGIDNRAGGGIHLLIFASSVRLDLASQSIVLDAALLPLTDDLVPRLADFLAQLHKRRIVSIVVNDDELVLWKHATPAYIERCRDWEHAPSCEYAADGVSVPLSTKFGEGFVCSCGLGKFPTSYKPNVPLWDSVAKYCIRAAIVPCFSVPFVQSVVDLDTLATHGTVGQAAAGMASLNLDREVCFTCKLKGTVGDQTLLKCGGCKVATYCSKECQVKDWKEQGHKRICKTLAAKRMSEP